MPKFVDKEKIRMFEDRKRSKESGVGLVESLIELIPDDPQASIDLRELSFKEA